MSAVPVSIEDLNEDRVMFEKDHANIFKFIFSDVKLDQELPELLTTRMQQLEPRE
jgi:hypothetical protein